MIFIADANSFLKDSDSAPHQLVKHRPIRQKNIVGSRFRSKDGCLLCRKRKKKCNEVHPTCGICRTKGDECVWPGGPASTQSTKKVTVAEISSKSIKETEKDNEMPKTNARNTTNNGDGIIDDEAILEIPRISTSMQVQGFSPTMLLPSVSDFLDDILLLQQFLPHFSSPLMYSPAATYTLFLDERGLSYLEFFQSSVSKLLCLSSEDSPNYFVKTFYSVAMHDEAVLNALAAWGGYFKEGCEDAIISKSYLKRARSIVSTRWENGFGSLDKFDRYVLLCYFMIEIGFFVCSGDTNNWFHSFKNAYDMLTDSYGGVLQICNDFSYSNDVKWLVSNLQFHDIMSSVTQKNGTLFEMNDYNTLFTQYKLLDAGGYGIDPFQGIIQPIYLIFGDIMNAHVTLKTRKSEIDQYIGETIPNPFLRQMRILFLEDSELKYEELKWMVESCQPSPIQISHLSKAGHKTINLHLSLFETVRNTCKLYMLLYLKKLPPSTIEVQHILLKSLESMESIADTDMGAALPMLLLIHGIAASLPSDRAAMEKIYRTIYSTYKVGNVRRVWEIVQEFWRRNQDGLKYIDWADICEEKEWSVSLC